MTENNINIYDHIDVINGNYEIRLDIISDMMIDELSYIKQEINSSKQNHKPLSPTQIEEIYKTLNDIIEELILYHQTYQDHQNFEERIGEDND